MFEMKKLLAMLTVFVIVLAIASTAVYAADAIWETKDGLLRPDGSNGAGNGIVEKDGELNVKRVEPGLEGDHPLWSYETAPIAFKTYTMVVKVKMIDTSDADAESVIFKIDPKVRGANGDIDLTRDITLEEIEGLKKDANGYVTLAMLMDKADMEANTGTADIKIEGRIHKGEDIAEYYVSYIGYYEGDQTALEVKAGGADPKPEDPKPEDPKPDPKPDNKPKTGDVGSMLAIVTVAAAAFGGLKLRKK